MLCWLSLLTGSHTPAAAVVTRMDLSNGWPNWTPFESLCFNYWLALSCGRASNAIRFLRIFRCISSARIYSSCGAIIIRSKLFPLSFLPFLFSLRLSLSLPFPPPPFSFPLSLLLLSLPHTYTRTHRTISPRGSRESNWPSYATRRSWQWTTGLPSEDQRETLKESPNRGSIPGSPTGGRVSPPPLQPEVYVQWNLRTRDTMGPTISSLVYREVVPISGVKSLKYILAWSWTK